MYILELRIQNLEFTTGVFIYGTFASTEQYVF